MGTKTTLLGVCLALAALALPGCAAWVRTWSFEAAPVSSQGVEVTVKAAQIKQRAAFVTLEVKNIATEPVALKVGTFRLTLEDGTEVVGKTNFVGRAADAVRDTFAGWGWTEKREEPPLAPGDSVAVKIAFRHPRRDLRRHPKIKVDLGAIVVNQASLAGTKIELSAPSEAPVGEDI